MFVLDELDELLKSLIPQGYRKGPGSGRNKVKVSLKDVQRINVGQLQLDSKTMSHLPTTQTHQSSPSTNPTDFANFFTSKTSDDILRPPTTDSLFLQAASRLILKPLSRTPDRHYPWAKLIICDQPGYNILLKVGQVLGSNSQPGDYHSSGATNFIYKPPFKMTAVILIDDIAKLVAQLDGEPIVSSIYKSSGKQLLSFNYSLIRQAFPCIKMSDIILLLSSRLLNMSALSTGKQERPSTGKILQFIAHYARTLQVLELDPLYRELGKPHLIYDNVLLMLADEVDPGEANLKLRPTQRMSLEQLSRLAARLLQLTSYLRLSLQSVTYRAGDLTGQSRVFSQFLSTASTKTPAPKINDNTMGQGQQVIRAARVIVVDRMQDVLGPLLHADLYGPFVDQEMENQKNGFSDPELQSPPDKLDKQLQLCRLTEVLPEVLRYSMELRSPSSAKRGAERSVGLVQSVKRHLNRIKLIYQRLNDGYLLVLRLELSLTSIAQQLRLATKLQPLTEQQHEQVADKVERTLEAFKQLVKLAGGSVQAGDLIRVACVMVHVCNLYLYLSAQQFTGQYRTEASQRCQQSLRGVRGYLLEGAGRHLTRVEATPDELAEVRAKFEAFERLSRESYASGGGTLSLVELLESFANEQLEQSSFPTINLASEQAQPASQPAGCCTIVTFLGQLSSLELARMKALEARLAIGNSKETLSRDMYILVAGSLVKPEQLLKRLL